MTLPKLPSSTSIASLAAQPHPQPYPIHPQVDYVLLAEFDIDEGSVLRHQYPAPTGTDEHLLAEHMLPDGAHDRTEDWTVFYLNQVPGLTVDPSLLASTPEGAEASAKGKGRAVDAGGARDDRLLYVMSLVRTKKDASVRRGALVKALAVATRNPYIQIYKPILLLALEDYFSTPSIAVLARLYTAINSMETPTLPFLTLNERTILRTSDRKDMFEEKFFDAAALADGVRRTPSTISFATRKSSQDEHVTEDGASSMAEEVLNPSSRPSRGGSGSGGALADLRNRSSGSLSSLASKDPSGIAGPASTNASTDDLGGSGSFRSRSRANTLTSSEGGESSVGAWNRDFAFAAANVPLPTAMSSPVESVAGRSSLPGGGVGGMGRPKDTHVYETKVAYGGINLPIRIPLGTYPSEVGDYSLIKLIQTFSSPTSLSPSPLHAHLHTSGAQTPPIIVLFNALLTGHRVVFLGHGQPAGHVAELVLAACALASGCGAVMGGFEERAFPYTNLSNLDNLQGVDGYIAGVCNPAFADRPSWWDLLCNIETGKITISKDLRSPPSSYSAATATATTRSNAASASWAAGAGGAGGGLEEGKDGKEGSKKEDKTGESPDNAFMDEILHAIQAHYGESVIRARFAEYAHRFVRLASRWEEETTSTTSIGFPCGPYANGRLGSGIVFGDEAAAGRELAANAPRIEGWMRTRSYKLYQQTFRQALHDSPLQGFDLGHQLARLRQGRQLPSGEVELILRTLAQNARSDDQIVALLAHLPPHFGGLLPLAFGLFHPSPSVRNSTLELFDQLSSHPTGRKFVVALNAFHRSAYTRLSSDRLAALARERERERDEASLGFGQGARERERERETTVTQPPPPSVPLSLGLGLGMGPPLPAKDFY
ncbi:hypothetical protein JCM1840_005123 [Sporobolomyces johnsonii]